MLFIIFIADLHPGGESNSLLKFTNNSSLLILEKTDVQINDKFNKVIACALENKLGINMAKTKEIVVHGPHPKIYFCQ